MKRVLVYSHDTFGLGNIRRMLEVARHLVASSREVSVLVITGSPMLHAFRLPERVDFIKLPCLARDVEGRYAARSLPMGLDDTVRLRANMIRSAVLDFRPDLVVVDKKPFGVEDELSGALEAMSGLVEKPSLVLLLRDILDGQAITSSVWRKNGYFDAIDTWYDRVLVVGSPEVFDLRREYQFPALAAAKVRFCGYIAREPGRQTRLQVRRRLGLDDHEPYVLVTPGGGADGSRMVEVALAGILAQPAQWRPRTHIVCGPEMPQETVARVMAMAQSQDWLTVETFNDDMMSLQAAADVVVCMGGYNTVCELLTCGRRAVIVPRVKPGVEQLLRAQRLSQMGLVSMVHPEDLTPETLVDALFQQIDALYGAMASPRLPARRGLERTSTALLELLGLSRDKAASRRPRAPAPARDPARAPRSVRQPMTVQA